MIAIDSNILLRLLLADDKDQYTKAKKLIDHAQKVLIVDAVLIETTWVIQGRKYKHPKEAVLTALKAIISDKRFEFEDFPVVAKAIATYEETRGIDFPDALILHASQNIADKKGMNFTGLYTFDKAAQSMPQTFAP